MLFSTAKTAGTTQLISEDMQHDFYLDGVRVVNPFHEQYKHDPLSVLMSSK